LLGLLGKGGFAEVYKAYDCQEFYYVVCKLIILDRNMEEEVKECFIKYAKRENTVF
jgi:tousled-like kinase